MNQYSIVIGDSGETSRKQISDMLIRRGYKVYQASDGPAVLRLVRRLYPDLVLLDTNIWGMGGFDIGRMIESEGLSTVLYITANPGTSFYAKLKDMRIFAYIHKPILASQLYQMIEVALMTSRKMKELEKKVEALEQTLEARKVIDRAKGRLMDCLELKEDEAFKWLRKESMNRCLPMEKIAKMVIEKYT